MSNTDAIAVVPSEEALALIKYVSDRGLDPDSGLIGPLKGALDQRAAADDEQEKIAAGDAVLREYAKLTAVTFPKYKVNGRSVLDSRQAFARSKWIILYALGFFVLAMGTEILDLYFGDTPVPEGGFDRTLSYIHSHVLTFLSPFFWGGLGSCIYLLKRLSDLAGDQSFDATLLKGYQTRIWLGALLGAVVQFIFFNDANITQTKVMLDANAVAFLSGVGVKVVYGAIEKTVDSLSKAINLDSLKSQRDAPDATNGDKPAERRNPGTGT